MAQMPTDFDDFGADGKPWLSAVQRGQNHQNPLGIDPVQGNVLIQSAYLGLFFPGPCNQTK